jgi:sarcosine oxidase/L-pipecolate oxidase
LPKLFEKLLEPLLFKTFNPILINEQHGFHRKKSTMTNLLRFYTNILESVEIGGQIDAIYTDLKKAFDSVNINLLIIKLRKLSMVGPLCS